MQEHKQKCSAESVANVCRELGFTFGEDVHASLAAYLALVEKWNAAMNLVGPSLWQDTLRTLVVDSFYLADFVGGLRLPEPEVETGFPTVSPSHLECWDLGAGAGLPGIPLRMLWQKGSYTLVEAREKRALFLRTVLAACPLPGVQVFRGRAEQFMPARPPVQLVVSRAFLPWPKVLALVAPYMAPGGLCVFLTREPLPGALPEGWTAEGEKRYSIQRSVRYFWALGTASPQ